MVSPRFTLKSFRSRAIDLYVAQSALPGGPASSLVPRATALVREIGAAGRIFARRVLVLQIIAGSASLRTDEAFALRSALAALRRASRALIRGQRVAASVVLLSLSGRALSAEIGALA